MENTGIQQFEEKSIDFQSMEITCGNFCYDLQNDIVVTGDDLNLLKSTKISDQEELKTRTETQPINNIIFDNQTIYLSIGNQIYSVLCENLDKNLNLLGSFEHPIKIFLLNKKYKLIIYIDDLENISSINIETKCVTKLKTPNNCSTFNACISDDENLLYLAGEDGLLSIYEIGEQGIKLKNNSLKIFENKYINNYNGKKKYSHVS